jgi:hypothetical protein
MAQNSQIVNIPKIPSLKLGKMTPAVLNRWADGINKQVTALQQYVANALANPNFGRVGSAGVSNGTVIPNTTTSFANAPVYVATSTSVTLHWDGTNGSSKLTIYNNDTTIAGPFSVTLTVTGLSPSTTYYIYPYFLAADSTVYLVQISGGIGTPPACYTSFNPYALQQSFLMGRIPLASAMSNSGFMTPASGSSSPTGGGNGGSGGKGGNTD